ncbi:MAG: hypothetical protein WKF97_07290 [Chitinophagaceae bacterium]
MKKLIVFLFCKSFPPLHIDQLQLMFLFSRSTFDRARLQPPTLIKTAPKQVYIINA